MGTEEGVEGRRGKGVEEAVEVCRGGLILRKSVKVLGIICIYREKSVPLQTE